MQPIEKASYWMPITAEVLADAPYVRGVAEYAMSTPAPLTLRERLTGYRHFTSSEGLEMRFYVGWRARWRRIVEFVRRPVDLGMGDE